MKKHFKLLNLGLVIGLFSLISSMVIAQNPTYTAELRSDLMVSSSVYEFDIYLTSTGVTPLEIANFQASILVNPSFVNGGTITPAIVGSSSDLNAAQVPTSIAFDPATGCIKIAPKAPPRTLVPATMTSTTDGTIIPASGSRVCRISLSNSVAFGSSTLDPIWNFSIQPYRTVVTAFVGPETSKVNTIITLAEAHSKTLNLALAIEGLWDDATGSLKKVQDADIDYNQFDKFPGLTSDTLTVQLAETTEPWNILYSAHGVNLNTDGKCRVSVPGSITGNYYVIIKHRNSVETWSKSGGEIFGGDLTSLDFSTSADQAFGSNQTSVSGGKFALFSGDVTSPGGVQDGYIDINDLNSIYNLNVESAFGFSSEDLTADGFVDINDLNMVYNNNVNSVGMNTPPNPAGKKKR
jgi:hypothetical protein